jgi:hypothetical protein
VEQPTPIEKRYERIGKQAYIYILPYFRSTFLLTATDKEPKSFREAVDSIEGKLWKENMFKEMEFLHNNETWDMVKLPNGRKLVSRKWVFKDEGFVVKGKKDLVFKLKTSLYGLNKTPRMWY